MTDTCDICYVCDLPIEGKSVPVENCRTGNIWHHHPGCDGNRTPVPDSYAATARMMAEICPVDDDPDFWDRWKDEMKERDL